MLIALIVVGVIAWLAMGTLVGGLAARVQLLGGRWDNEDLIFLGLMCWPVTLVFLIGHLTIRLARRIEGQDG